MPAIDSVTVLVLSNTGSRYEQPQEKGLAHFFEHLVFKGTQKFPDAQTLATTIESVGADFNAFTSKEYTGYYVKAAAEHVELALDVISDMLLAPRLRQADIDREKGVVIEELNMYVDMPARHVGNLFDRMMFADSGLGHDIVGTKETIRQFKTEDFQRFLQQWYGLGNLVLVLAGQAEVVQSQQTQKLVEQYFAKDASARVKNKIVLAPYLVQNPISKQKLHVELREIEQAHFVLGWPGLKRGDAQRYALALLSVIVGGNMSSRLFSEVREKRGLCYYVNSCVDQFHDAGLFGASAGVDPQRVEEALKVSIGEFTKMAAGSKPLTEVELQRAKDYVIGKMILSFEDSQAVAQYFGLKQVLMNEIETPTELITKLKQVSLEQVQALAKDLIKSDELRLAVIGPFKDRAKFERLIGK